MPLKPSRCTLIIEHEQSSAGQVWVKSAPLCASSSCHTMMFAVTHYHVTDCSIKLLGPLPESHPQSHQSVSTYDGAHVCMATSLLKTTLTSWRPFFSPLQHVCNSPAVPQIEAFSLIYHQSVRLSTERGWLFQARNKMRWKEKKKKKIIMCGCRDILTCII